MSNGIRGSNALSRIQSLSKLSGHVNDIKSTQHHGQVLLLHPLHDIEVAPQVREMFKDVELLADSFLENGGQLQPVQVHPKNGNGKYPLVSGERRYRASLLVLQKNPDFRLKAIIDETGLVASDKTANQIIENINRQDLTQMETARGLQKLRAQIQAESQGTRVTNRLLAKRLGMTEHWIGDHLQLMEFSSYITDLLESEITGDIELIKELARLDEVNPILCRRLSEEAKIQGPGQGVISRKLVRDAINDIKKRASSNSGDPQQSGTDAVVPSSSSIAVEVKEPAKSPDLPPAKSMDKTGLNRLESTAKKTDSTKEGQSSVDPSIKNSTGGKLEGPREPVRILVTASIDGKDYESELLLGEGSSENHVKVKYRVKGATAVHFADVPLDRIKLTKIIREH